MQLTPEIKLTDAQSRVIATLIREELARRRISRQLLADQAKISISTLEKALSGRRPFSIDSLPNSALRSTIVTICPSVCRLLAS